MLSLTALEAEWVEYAPCGGTRYARVPVEGLAPGDLAAAAVAARNAAGGQRRSCVLVLGDGLVRHGVQKLPPLARKDLERVVARKAAAECETSPGETLFSCLQLWNRGEDSGHWTVAMIERKRMLETQLHLRSHGFKVRRVTSISTAILNRARLLTRDSDTATIVVVIGPRAVEVSLIAGDEQVSSEVLKGDFLEAGHLVASLVQSVRTLAAFWRRAKRGQEVGDICLFGLPPDRGSLLAQTLQSTLPEVDVHVEPGADAEEEHAGRIALLAGCFDDGPLAVDLTLRLPWRNSTILAAATLIVAVTFGSFWFTQRSLAEKRQKLAFEAARLEQCEPDLLELQEASENAGRDLAELQRQLEQAEAVWGHEAEYEKVLVALAGVFEGRATFLGMSLERGTDGGRNLTVNGLTTADPVRSVATIGEMERELSLMPGFQEVRIDLPSRIGGGDAGQPISFTLQAHLEASS